MRLINAMGCLEADEKLFIQGGGATLPFLESNLTASHSPGTVGS